MRMIDCKFPIRVLGVKFENIREVIQCACKGIPKDGVYVGEDAEHYPCFDFEDSASETRFYWNFVFATSQSELEQKMKVQKEMTPIASNYNKFTEELAPMAYWGGDSYMKVEITSDIDYL